MNSIRYCVWIVCTCLVPCLAFPYGQTSSWEDTIRLGKELRKLGRYQQAEQEYLAALQEAERFGEKDPRLSVVLENLGELRILRGNYSEAEKCLRLALSTE